MSKNASEALQAGDDGDGLMKGMDVIMEESAFPATAFDDDHMKQDEQVMSVNGGCGEREIWFGRDHRGHDQDSSLLDDDDDADVNNDPCSLFYTDFPPIPDFPCMSSSSSSSSTPLPARAVASTSSSSSSSSSSAATSWAVFKSEPDDSFHRNSEAEMQRYHPLERQCDEVVNAAAAAAALSSTASMEILPLPDDYCSNRDMNCMNAMENFGYMDLLDNSDIWDPCSIFESENVNPPQQDHDHQFQERKPASSACATPNHQEDQIQAPSQHHQPVEEDGNDNGNDGGLYFLQGNSELGVIFLEWLKQNKDHISAEDMRSIKLKRSTIECASKRLGCTKEGKKQLLKLILEWVEQYQLHKRRATEMGSRAAADFDPISYHYHEQAPAAAAAHETINPNPNPNPSPTTTDLINCKSVVPCSHQDPSTACLSPSPSPWVPPAPPCESCPNSLAAPFPPTMGGYACDPYSCAAAATVAVAVPVSNQTMNNANLYLVPAEYHQPTDSPQSWSGPYSMPQAQYNPFPDNTKLPVSGSQAQALYANPYPYQVFDGSSGERLVRYGSSATKEARKKRMARQRRISLHQYRHHHSHHHHTHQNQPQSLVNEQHATRIPAVGDDCTSNSPANPGNWIYWSPAVPPPAPAPMASTMRPLVSPDEPSHRQAPTQPVDRAYLQPQQNHQRQVPSSDRKQSWKTEKNLKFLLQKVLKQSDVGNLGRIVLPKKEAETHLPELESRDGIPIALEDIGTSNVWNMRYRFWPNNKSRMYLLENTGDFVRVNGLQEGDFIVIYSDTKCGKYLIRGVKVRQPGSKSEAKKPARRNQRNVPQAANNFALASFKQTVKRTTN
ncbi:B3 domain-containing transcription factor ABI3 [Coffea eugenioides]|uniref:B3 domain-containing transcription factor ABI3 n=1 Tax=Coffea eugenioides TaxID=49369 RepID=UPI000F613BF8|nr:B3 domain-containing transcription factor ABI3 [Coffea eugenioides]